MTSLPSFSANARRLERLLAAAILTLAVLAFAPDAALAQIAVAPAAGDGLTTDTAYQITELGNLVWLHDQAAAGATSGQYYKLMNDIDASATATWNDSGTDTSILEGFNPIGNGTASFNGIFLGQGHKITGLVINRASTFYVGLFGYVSSGGRVQDLGLKGGAVMGFYEVGGLVGENYGTVSNCYAGGAVTGTGDVGGLIGYNYYGMVSNCHATGAVTGSGNNIGGLVGYNYYGMVSNCHATGAATGNEYVGGLIGYNYYGTVSNCYATSAVTGTDDIGGLIGDNYSGTVSNCHATGAVTGDSYVSGLVGGNFNGTVSDCYATGAVTGGYYVGGLVGRNGYAGYYSTISHCYATGAVTGTEDVGGLVGDNGGTVSDCDATGVVTGTTYVGGLVGLNSYYSYYYYGTVSKCYATGVVAGTTYVGGLVGENDGTVTASCWNKETSGQSSSSDGTGLTIAQMKMASTFTAVGWNFTSTWAISGAYPYLQALTTCTLTYQAGAHGRIGDGLTTGTSPLAQVINLASTGTPVKAVSDAGYRFTQWDDGSTANPRTDANVTTDTTVTAEFVSGNAADAWRAYR
jgi:hypothetical protein